MVGDTLQASTLGQPPNHDQCLGLGHRPGVGGVEGGVGWGGRRAGWIHVHAQPVTVERPF